MSSENNLKGKSYIAFFDLDNTLITSNSGLLLVREARAKEMMSLQDLIRALWMSFLYKFNLRDTEKIIAGMLQWLNGVPVKKINELASEVFLKQMLRTIADEARSEIKWHLDRNAATVILSSALYPVCQAVAGHLNIDDIICTQLETVDGNYTGKPAGKPCFGNEKAYRLKEYCEKNNNKVEAAWYYGDSISDFPALQIVGTPVCVNPDRKLLKAANKNNWKICSWK
jgi:putative phosphoserine phosphatase/1-acylglycerol-3-phosphate O-acyltransferase